MAGTCVIIGAGNIGLRLIRNLSREFTLVCVDRNEQALKTVRELRGNDLTVLTGDATSRLVLEEAGVEDADLVVITTTEEKVSIEVARVLHDHFRVRRLLSVAITQKGIETLEELGAEVENIFTWSAIGLRNRIEYRTKTVQGIGLGKNEILEVEVHPNSRLAHKSLASLAQANWRVGLIYREGNILVPRGGVQLKPRDRVVLLGQPQVVRTVAEMLTFRLVHFPLEYGSSAVVWLYGGEEEAFFAEIAYLFKVFPLERAVLLHAERHRAHAEEGVRRLRENGLERVERRPARRGLLPTVRSLAAENASLCGLLVLDRSALLEGGRNRLLHVRRKRLLQKLSAAASCPLLLAGGTSPYRDVAVPCLTGTDVQPALEATFEMSAALQYRIEALLVSLSRYISSAGEQENFAQVRKLVADLALVYKARMKETILRGNPVEAINAVTPDFNLMVGDVGNWRRPNWASALLNPDVAWRVVRDAPISTLLIPAVGESL